MVRASGSPGSAPEIQLLRRLSARTCRFLGILSRLTTINKDDIVGLEAFASIVNIFRGKAPSDEERQKLFSEALLLTLSRATTSDENINPVEVEAVQAIMKSVAGEEVTSADVRVAAGSEIYETASLYDYLSATGRKLESGERAKFVKSLAEIIKSDRRISQAEIAFFNKVVSSLHATPAEIAGLEE
jgi:uncharacterized tellurite resistance protein B-like protein